MKFVTLSLIVCLIAPPAAFAQESNTNWAVLKVIPSGQLLLVKTASGKSLKGRLQRINDSALELSVKDKNVTVQSAEVLRVYCLRGRQALKGTLIGAAVGTAGGATIGAIGGRGEDFILDQKAITAICAAVGFILGSITGLVVGLTRHKKELVYQAT